MHEFEYDLRYMICNVNCMIRSVMLLYPWTLACKVIVVIKKSEALGVLKLSRVHCIIVHTSCRAHVAAQGSLQTGNIFFFFSSNNNIL